MQKKVPFSYLLLFLSAPLFSMTTPIFFADFVSHYYFGQNLYLSNNAQSFDSYSLFQCIFDTGIRLDKELTPEKKQTVSLLADIRMKGLFGNAGSCLTFANDPVKIGWAKTETITTGELDKFLIWVRELSVTYCPTKNKNSFFEIGLFPFRIGNGFVLGNAYKANIPITWQYVYEQIDQFRPGLLLQLTNQTGSVSGNAYLGIITAQSTTFAQNASTTNIQNLETPYPQSGAGKGNIVASTQLTISPFSEQKIQISPYLFFQKTDQSIEFFNDATSTLFTPGIYGSYEKGSVRFGFEFAKNLGHQHVKKWDRNQLIASSGSIFNTHLFYAPNTTIPLAAVTDTDFIPSNLVIRPACIAEGYGNGTNFLYSPDQKTTFIFKNSYDRIRNGYNNTYTGFLAYVDLLITHNNLMWGAAFAYTSGGTGVNDSYDTITMTRLTPGIRYSDYNKKNKSFLGINQFYEAKSVNPLYFGAGDYTYSNLCFVGSTLQYSLPNESNTFSAQGTIVTYFKPAVPTKGLSATLWQEQSLDFTDQMRRDMNLRLSHYLGTELNFSGSYSIESDLTFSILGGIFFPGHFYEKLAGKTISLQTQEQLNQPNFSPDEGPAITYGNNTSFFLSVALTLLFDSSLYEKFFKQGHE